ncbi:histidine kinase [Allosphingosinicella flava]|uniref:Histidine kinase n=1 Tax=Allosphingosinicella flava TaxID=2771430 RepID=A0A7T2GL22_9SPHN|nr:histidine kinase [Sphingosinicella flava]QPQ55831.1 histidine kinase [Sphingosinicella flava]
MKGARGHDTIGVSILLIALLYWSSFVILTSVSAVIGGYHYGLINLPLDFSLITFATLTALGIFKMLSRLTALPFRQQALIALVAMFAIAFLFDIGFQLIRTVFGPDAAELTVETAVTRENIVRGGLFWFVPLCLWAAAVLALLHSDAARRRERQLLTAEKEATVQLARAAEAESKAARSELAMLRAQLDPHFMCNALNAVSGLILMGRQDDATATIDRLAAFMRSATEIGDQEITLQDELDIAEAFLAVQAMRFGDRLRLTLDCDDEILDALVPNFLLQPLVENSVKYAVEHSPDPVEIVIAARREGDTLVLTVSDDGKIAVPAKPGRKGGVGLTNARARLGLRYGLAASLETGRLDGGYRTIIRLPFKTQESAPSAG